MPGKRTGNRSEVGLFFPIPKELGFKNELGSFDQSPPHVTFLYVGAIPADREALFIEIVGSAFARLDRPVEARLEALDTFVNPKAGQMVVYQNVRFDYDLKLLRSDLYRKLLDAGFDVKEQSPLVYTPHLTRKYLPDIVTKADPKKFVWPLAGKWLINHVEVWGLPQVQQIFFVAPKVG